MGVFGCYFTVITIIPRINTLVNTSTIAKLCLTIGCKKGRYFSALFPVLRMSNKPFELLLDFFVKCRVRALRFALLFAA